MGIGDALFANAYDLLAGGVEKSVAKYRMATAGMATGDVLEIGAGTGANLPYYRDDVRLTLLEPSPGMTKRLRKKLAMLGKDATTVLQTGERLPFGDASFDAVVATLVLCSVGSLGAVLSEVRRVLRPHGAFYFYEHVAAAGGITRRAQNVLNPVWKLVVGGCNLNRETESAIKAAGFSAVEVVRFGLPISPPIVRPSIVGVAWA
ncbi:MAG: methyltransferase domain-containing protein [SAR202 cluster bacterium]|nr:methyltransferase domain-containing protein [SAR202 cluster bacterium]